MKELSLTSFICSLILIGTLVGCGTTMPYQEETTNEFIDNSLIIARCKTKLIDDKLIRGHNIVVSSQKGIVYLAGNVESDLQKLHATHLVSSVEGVKSVENELVVTKD